MSTGIILHRGFDLYATPAEAASAFARFGATAPPLLLPYGRGDRTMLLPYGRPADIVSIDLPAARTRVGVASWLRVTYDPSQTGSEDPVMSLSTRALRDVIVTRQGWDSHGEISVTLSRGWGGQLSLALYSRLPDSPDAYAAKISGDAIIPRDEPVHIELVAELDAPTVRLYINGSLALDAPCDAGAQIECVNLHGSSSSQGGHASGFSDIVVWDPALRGPLGPVDVRFVPADHPDFAAPLDDAYVDAPRGSQIEFGMPGGLATGDIMAAFIAVRSRSEMEGMGYKLRADAVQDGVPVRTAATLILPGSGAAIHEWELPSSLTPADLDALKIKLLAL